MVYIISIITFDIVYYFTHSHTHTINNIHLHLLISTFPTDRERWGLAALYVPDLRPDHPTFGPFNDKTLLISVGDVPMLFANPCFSFEDVFYFL